MDIQAAIDALGDETRSTIDNIQAVLDGTIGALSKCAQATVNHALCKFWINLTSIEGNICQNIWIYLKQLHYIDMFYVLGCMVWTDIRLKKVNIINELLRANIDMCNIIVQSLYEKDLNALKKKRDSGVTMTEQEYMIIAAGDMYCHDRNVYLQAIEKTI